MTLDTNDDNFYPICFYSLVILIDKRSGKASVPASVPQFHISDDTRQGVGHLGPRPSNSFVPASRRAWTTFIQFLGVSQIWSFATFSRWCSCPTWAGQILSALLGDLQVPRSYTLGQIRALASGPSRGRCTDKTPSAKFNSRRAVAVHPWWCPAQSLTLHTKRLTARAEKEISSLLERKGLKTWEPSSLLIFVGFQVLSEEGPKQLQDQWKQVDGQLHFRQNSSERGGRVHHCLLGSRSNRSNWGKPPYKKGWGVLFSAQIY